MGTTSIMLRLLGLINRRPSFCCGCCWSWLLLTCAAPSLLLAEPASVAIAGMCHADVNYSGSSTNSSMVSLE
jgi:hypothetical protein